MFCVRGSLGLAVFSSLIFVAPAFAEHGGHGGGGGHMGGGGMHVGGGGGMHTGGGMAMPHMGGGMPMHQFPMQQHPMYQNHQNFRPNYGGGYGYGYGGYYPNRGYNSGAYNNQFRGQYPQARTNVGAYRGNGAYHSPNMNRGLSPGNSYFSPANHPGLPNALSHNGSHFTPPAAGNHLNNTFINQNRLNSERSYQQHHTPDVARRVDWYRTNWAYPRYSNWYQRAQTYNGYWNSGRFRNYYGAYNPYGFYGGYYYPFVPCYNIYSYFTLPLFQWLFLNQTAPNYYGQYYGSAYDQYPINTFPYQQAYYPTATTRDLLLDAQGLPIEQQAKFRTALERATGQLGDLLKQRFPGFTFGSNDINLTRYENLKNQAYEIVGFLEHGDIHASFQALIDLQNPENSLLFSPAGQNPSPEEIETLQKITDRKAQIGN